MASLNQIKERIKLTKNIEKITSALKLTSSTKMKRLLLGFSQFKTFMEGVYSALDLLGKSYDIVENKKTLIYVISSEIGLCGAYNSRVFNTFLNQIKNIDDYEVIHIGKKLEKKLKKYNAVNLNIPISINSRAVLHVVNKEANKISDLLNNKEVSRVIVIGHQFINQLIQQPKVYEILPFQTRNDKYKESLVNATEFVPNKEEVLNSIIPFYLSVALRAALFESALCIEAMRNMAMDNATNNANDFIEKLTLKHNRARQAMITQEIIEIVSGADGGQ